MLAVTRPYTNNPLTPQEFELRAELYFNQCVVSTTPVTLTGLAYNTGFRSTAALREHALDHNWADVIQAAMTYVAMGYETRLCQPGSSGSIFALKNIDNWTEKQTVTVENGPDTSTPVSRIALHLQRIEDMRLVETEKLALLHVSEDSSAAANPQ